MPDWINRGALLQDLGRHAEALVSYDKALALAPDDTSIVVNRANALAMLERLPKPRPSTTTSSSAIPSSRWLSRTKVWR